MYKILIADDEALMRKGLCTLIDWAKLGCQIVGTAENGLQAKQAVLDYQPDIIIADIKMPVMDGLDATRAIRALPDGYDTVCSEGMFSQGEWQLLSIARAAAADPAVLLLDEITANLDAETEARVLEALRRASVGRTVLSVSHRIYENLGGRTVEIRTQGLE